MRKKTQILIIHGGMTFKTKKNYLKFLKTRPISIEKKNFWTGEYLNKKLDGISEIIRPRMPLKDNAKYEEWKIHFERHIPLLKNNIILIGVSLGGIFLAKYLSENKFPKKILSTYMIAPPYNDKLEEKKLCGGFKLKKDLKLIEKNSKNLCLMFSKDDKIVPISHAEKYQKKLKKENIIIYENKNGHFFISEFPELIKKIKKDLKTISN